MVKKKVRKKKTVKTIQTCFWRLCNQKFRNFSDKKKHLKLHHYENCCDRCFLRFDSAQELNFHLKSFSKPHFICKVESCQQKFWYIFVKNMIF